MSAWMVSKAHIDALVDALARREMLSGSSLDEMGRVLWGENARSFNYRYDNRYTDEVPDTDAYTFAKPATEWNQHQVLTHIACFNYQACEHPEWESSQAYQMMRDLELALIANGAKRDLDNAPWGICECGGTHPMWQACPA